MKTVIPFLSLALFFTSCSVYKSGQTPDDVYFSPERPQDEYVQVNQKKEPKQYNPVEESSEDQYLRMVVRDRYRWSTIDYNDYNVYRYDPYNHCEYVGVHTFWNNYFYSPYAYAPYGVLYTYYPKAVAYNKPRVYNLQYNPQPVTNTYNPKMGTRVFNQPSYSSPSSTNNNYRNSGTNAGQFLRDVFGKSNSTPSNTNASSGNSSTSNNSSSSSSSSSGSSAPVRRF
jgi:hypothetical protein